MNNEIKKEAEFLFRRLTPDFPMSDWAIFVPILFALAVILLVILLRREDRFRGMQWALLLVGAFSVVHLFLAFTFKSMFSWWVVLVPVLLVALVYVALMYVRDAKTIHPVWASFLGLLRCTVYFIIAFVFLLPSFQLYDTLQRNWKTLILFDVSGSMGTIDDLPEVGQDPKLLPTRQDKVIAFATEKKGKNSEEMKPAFLQQLLDKTPVSAYRFGMRPDTRFVAKFEIDQPFDKYDWASWLKPDRNNIRVPNADKLSEDEKAKERGKLYELIESLTRGTNIGGSAMQVANLEMNSLLQAVIIISDGQSNLGSEDTIEEFKARLNAGQRVVPVFTVGVGEYRQPVSIRIDDLQAPEDARPDDKFPVRVPVVGPGLTDEEFQVTLEAQRISDKEGTALKGETKYVLGPLTSKFEGKGDFPRNQIDFEIDLQDLTKIRADSDKSDQLEGVWQFIAKVPRHPREAFPEAEHVSEPPTKVIVQKRKLRVLLFAGGPTRDYQFLRTMLYREAMEKRVDLSVYLQTTRNRDNIDQDVDGERLLLHFPDKLGAEDSVDKYSSLNEHDVIIAVDPDWSQLTDKQFELMETWVSRDAGGIVFVAGPVHSYFMSRPAGRNLGPLLSLLPVTLEDSRLHKFGIGHDASRPYALNFTASAKLFDFLKLDDSSEDPTKSWDNFFWRGKKPEPGKDVAPERGFYNYYPVKKVSPAAQVVATFAGPASSRINDGRDEQPYMVVTRYGQGKTMYIGSPETWRLRHDKAEFHQRFWIKLARYVSGGTTMQKKYGRILMQRNSTTGTIPMEAQLKGADLQPLQRDHIVSVTVKRPDSFDEQLDPVTPKIFDLKPKTSDGEWNGSFAGNFHVRTPGEYEFKISIPGTSQSLSHRLTVRKPDVEMDNVRNNFGRLYQIASDAAPVFEKLKADKRREIQQLLQPPSLKELEEVGETPNAEKPRLFFTLNNAHLIPECLTRLAPKKESIKGQLQDVWDNGFGIGLKPVSAYYLLLVIPPVLGILIAAILLFLRQYVGAMVLLGLTGVYAVGVFAIDLLAKPDWADFPVDVSFVLAVVVGLLAVEWLTRKLLKLA